MTRKQSHVFCFFLHCFLACLSAAVPLQAKTFTVNSNSSAADFFPGDGVCQTGTGICTLHAAIEEANLDNEPSTINFAARFRDTNSIWGCSFLPSLTRGSTTIDASSMWDSSNDQPGVEILNSGCDLLTIVSSGNSIMGLEFNGSTTVGVKITSGDQNRIGGNDTGQRNVFVTGRTGVLVEAGGATNYINNNYFGTRDGSNLIGATGEYGINVNTSPSATNTIITDNLIGGQSLAGIHLFSDGNHVSGNFIGISKGRSHALPNTIGIIVGGDFNVIEDYNIIACNTSHGIYLGHSDNTSIFGNEIGYTYHKCHSGGDGIHNHVSDNTKIGKEIFGNQIDGNSGHGIFVNISTGVSIMRNSISNSGADGIHFNNSTGYIGSALAGKNTINSNAGDGIELTGSSNVSIIGNHIGLKTGVYDAGNAQHGIIINGGSHNNSVGGEQSGEGNWISWNKKDGIQINGSSTHDNIVLGNKIGAPTNWGWQAANGNHGVSVYAGAYNNTIGGLGGGNTIISSGWSGVAIVDSSTNKILANRIGTNGFGKNWGNTYYGVHIVGSGSGNFISFNEIAYSGSHNGIDANEAGIKIDGSQANLIGQNSIHDNDGPGISLTNGGNTHIAAPVINQASCSGPVSGSAGGPGWVIEIFSDRDNEGGTYEGTAISSSGGNWTWNGKLTGPHVTATARSSTNDTSQFSTFFNLGSNCFPWHMFMPAIEAAKVR